MKFTRTALLFFMSLFFSLQGQAKNEKIKFGKVKLSDINQEVYSIDSAANAIVLADIGDLEILYSPSDKHFVYEFKKHIRVKVLDEGGLEWGDFTISQYDNNDYEERVSGIKGFVYNANGNQVEKIKLNKTNIFKTKKSKYITTYKVAFPSVKVGSVIDLTYRIRCNSLFRLPTWYFQKSVPVLYSSYTTRIPEHYMYQENYRGFLKLDEENPSNSQRSTMISGSKHDYLLNTTERICRNIPALTGEKFVTTLDNYYYQIGHQLVRTNFFGNIKMIVSSWEALTSELRISSRFGAYIKERPFKDFAKSVETKNAKEKIALTYKHVQDLLDWNENYGLYTKDNLNAVLNRKKGSISEINLALVGALKAADIEAYPVILSTRENGNTHPTLPLLENYNYVIAIAYYDDQYVLLDASSNHLSVGQLPYRCLNYIARVVKEKTCERIEIVAKEGFVVKTDGAMTIAEDGSIKTRLRKQYKGYEALSVKRQTNSDASEEEFKKELGEEYSDWEIEKLDLKQGKFPTANISLTKEAEDEDADLIYISPLLDKLENYFQQENRLHPVDIGTNLYDYNRYYYQLPANYTIEELPESVKYVLPNGGGSFTYNIQQSGNTIQLLCILDLKKAVYQNTEYTYLREIFNKAIAKQGEQIVLKKKDSE